MNKYILHDHINMKKAYKNPSHVLYLGHHTGLESKKIYAKL